jgi:hypothetical protein
LIFKELCNLILRKNKTVKVNFGIIGFGFVGHIHENVKFNRSYKVVAICDIEEENDRFNY